MTDLYSHAERIDARLLAHDQHLGELDAAHASIGRIDERLVTHDRQFKAIDEFHADIARIDERLVTHDRQLKAIDDIRSDIARIDTRLVAHDADYIDLRNRLETIIRRLQVVTRHVQTERHARAGRSQEPLPTRKLRVKDNTRLSDSEFEKCRALREILAAVNRHAQAAAPEGGIAWDEIARNPSYHLDSTIRGNLDLSFLLRTWFRDFPTICYEEDHFTPQPDYWVRRYLRLRAGIPERWRFQLPARFGEIGWDVDGFPVNRHTCLIQERINALYLAGALRRIEASPQRRVIEIGGGAGELAYGLCRAIPGLTWYDCDLVHSLAFNAAHLAVLLPEKRHVVYVGDIPLPPGIDPALVIRSPAEAAMLEDAIVNVPHFLVNDLEPYLRLKLALNFWSFAEMPAAAVEAYGRLLSRCLTEDGLLIEQNGNFAHRGGADVRSILPEHFPHHLEVGGLFRMSRGNPTFANPVHIWSASAQIEARLSDFEPTELRRLIASFDDRGDEPDLEFSLTAWDGLQGIQARMSGQG